VRSDAADARPLERLQAACDETRSRTAGRAPGGVRHEEADDVIGTFDTDDAIGFDPFPMLAIMQRTGANYAVFGQVAGIMHGSAELTGDLDILWDGDSAAIDDLAEAFSAADLTLRDEHFEVVAEPAYRATLGGRKAVSGAKHLRRAEELEALSAGYVC